MLQLSKLIYRFFKEPENDQVASTQIFITT